MKKSLLLGCLVFVCLTASNLLQHVTLASIVEITEEDSNDPTISVQSSRPETTYSGKLGFKTRSWGSRSGFQHQYKAGEEFCMYTPVLGMRNLTTIILLSKYWDIDMELILSNSEGEILQRASVQAVGKRSPYATLQYNNIPRPDIVELCARNTGSTKTVQQYVVQMRDNEVLEYIETMNNATATHNISAEALLRIEGRLAEISILTKTDVASIRQDYFRLVGIGNWVDRRCAISCALMLFCCFMSTVVIRRWFGSPRSSV